MDERATAGLGGTMSVAASRLTVGDSVYRELLNAIYDGRLLPGQRLNDIALANELGISRTPVREAIQQLRSIGVVESEPNRFTRVAIVTPEQVRQHLIVWVALMHAVIDEVLPAVPKGVLRRMDAHHRQFARALDALTALGQGGAQLERRIEKSRELATASFDFFTSLTETSANAPLRAALERAQHVMRLGSLSLPEWLDVAGLAAAQADLLAALGSGDRDASHAVLARLRDLVVPGAEGSTATA